MMDRLDNMKTALNQILDNATNVNVGLMRFSDPGGPVLFPVSYVDEDGNRTLDEQVRTTASGQLGFGWQPNHQQTCCR